MPVYQHRCAACGEFEELRALERAGDGARCPGCGRPAARVFSAPAVHRATPLRAVRERVDSAQPRVVAKQTGGPAGGGHHGRPWQLGH